jgi:hypothetical protein
MLSREVLTEIAKKIEVMERELREVGEQLNSGHHPFTRNCLQDARREMTRAVEAIIEVRDLTPA